MDREDKRKTDELVECYEQLPEHAQIIILISANALLLSEKMRKEQEAAVWHILKKGDKDNVWMVD